MLRRIGRTAVIVVAVWAGMLLLAFLGAAILGAVEGTCG